jgi:hypothetical protein
MTNRRRLFGWVLAAGAVTCGLAASSASAANFTADEYPAVFEGGQVTTHKFTLGKEGGKIECADATFKAEIANAVHELTVFPEWGGCFDHIGEKVEPVTFTVGCYLIFVATLATEGTMDVKCEAGKAIVIDVGTICAITITGQGPLNGLKYKNLGGTSGIEVTTEVNLVGKPSNFLCGEGKITWTGSTIYTIKSAKTSLRIHGDVG